MKSLDPAGAFLRSLIRPGGAGGFVDFMLLKQN